MANSDTEKAYPVDDKTTPSGSTKAESTKENEVDSKDLEYPEGGARGWAVAIGAAAILFSTFGYANAFGYVNTSSH